MQINRFPTTPMANTPMNQTTASRSTFRANGSTMGVRGFKNLMSRSTPIMSDEDLKEAVREQARKDAANDNFNWHGTEFTRLRNAFISVASPDRHSIIGGHPIVRAAMAFNIGMPPFLNISHGGSSIAQFSAQRGWEGNITPAESARLQIISDVYHDAFMAARNGTDGSGGDGNVSVNAGSIVSTLA